MSSQAFTVEEATDLPPLSELANAILDADTRAKSITVPSYTNGSFSICAKTKDGRIIGGVVGNVACNGLRIGLLAVSPDCAHHGIGTALMKRAEEAARTTFHCNQMYLATFSWQARGFYEKLGYTLQWTLENHPRGYNKHYLEKTWPMEACEGAADSSLRDYDGASTDVVIEDWERAEASAQLSAWMDAHTLAQAIPIPPFRPVVAGVQAVDADRQRIGACLYDTALNSLFFYTFAVAERMRNRGVGTAMLRKVVLLAREKGCDHVLLTCRSWQARTFFEKNGFAVVSTQKDLPMGYETYLCLHSLSTDHVL